MKIQKKSLTAIVKKINALEKKAEQYAIWVDCMDYLSDPYIMGYSSNGIRLMNRAENHYYRLQNN